MSRARREPRGILLTAPGAGRTIAVWLRLAATLAAVAALAAGGRVKAAGEPPPASVRITSPLGRTGVASRVRIVAQVVAPAGVSYVRFTVDDQVVGTVTEGPPFAVDWDDANPFERRVIGVEAGDLAGATVRDSVVLPPFEVTDKTEVTSVLLETGVYDAGGKFVAQMDPSNFHVREDGVEQALDQVGRELIPATMVLLVDASQSMWRRMEFVQLAAARLATALRAKDKLIVAPFTTKIGSITGPTDDPATISEAIGALKAKGGTAIFDALLDSTKLLEGVDGRRAVILITDGYDENSASTFDDVLKAAEAANVTVYVVGIGGVAGISLKGETILRKVADQTGGRVFFPPREPDLVPIAASVAADAHSRYLLTYTPKNQKKDGKWREVSVEVPEGLKVRTRAGYFAPAPAPIRPTLEFTVTDMERHFVDVTSEDLEVDEDGVPQSVDTFQEAVDPVSIVMALDSSGSMKKAAEAVQEAAREFVLAVRPEDNLALITFADKPVFAHVLAANRQWSLDAIAKYQPNGGTALYDALWNSLMHLKGVPGRHAIVVLTDGKDENNPGTAPGSEHTIADVLKLLKTVGATVFPIGLGTKVEKPVLEQLATASGGEAYFPTDVSGLAAQYKRVVENLRRRYVLSYTSTNADHDGEWRAVEIKMRAPGFTIASSGGYYAPGK